jgi:site-specific recombinase XerD
MKLAGGLGCELQRAYSGLTVPAISLPYRSFVYKQCPFVAKKSGSACPRKLAFVMYFAHRDVAPQHWEAVEGAASYASREKNHMLASCCASVTVPELEQPKAAVLSTLASAHSRRSYKYAIERFIDWYCSEPRIGFNRSVVLRYRAFLEGLTLSAATVNLHLSAIRCLADEAAESGLLSPELAIGIRRVKGVKRLGRRIGNWLTGDQAQDLVNAISQCTLRGRRDAAMIGLLLGCGLRRSETVNLRLDQLQSRQNHWVIVDMLGKGGRLRTVPVPIWCKSLIDAWLRNSRVTEGKVFRRVSKNGARQDDGVKTDVVWYAVKRYAKKIGLDHLAPTIFVAHAPASATKQEVNSNRFSFYVSTWSRIGANHRAVHWVQAKFKRGGKRSI